MICPWLWPWSVILQSLDAASRIVCVKAEIFLNNRIRKKVYNLQVLFGPSTYWPVYKGCPLCPEQFKWVFDFSSSDSSPSDTEVAQDDQDTEDHYYLQNSVESDPEEDELPSLQKVPIASLPSPNCTLKWKKYICWEHKPVRPHWQGDHCFHSSSFSWVEQESRNHISSISSSRWQGRRHLLWRDCY